MKFARLNTYLIEESGKVKELLRWTDSHLPCRVNKQVLVLGRIPWPIKVIAYESFSNVAICCRTDAYPLLWMWYWIAYRMQETLRLTSMWIVMVGMVWGFAYAPPHEQISIRRHLFRRKPNHL